MLLKVCRKPVPEVRCWQVESWWLELGVQGNVLAYRKDIWSQSRITDLQLEMFNVLVR